MHLFVSRGALRPRFFLSLRLFKSGLRGALEFRGDTPLLASEKRWIGETHVHALNYCMLLLDSEAQQLAIYIGWLLRYHVIR